MRWYKPELGERRTVRKFLWFPKRLHRETRWLEFAWIEQCYDRNPFGFRETAWRNGWWATSPYDHPESEAFVDSRFPERKLS